MVQEGARKCSHCGHNGHNSRTCNGKGCVKIFGVNLLHQKHNHHHDQLDQQSDPLIKSASMGNLASLLDDNNQARHVLDRDGYNSDGYISSNRNQTPHERKKGKPWTEEEHREFLTGLQKRGKGDWRGISKNFVVSRTPTQVASHAQKYFLRQASTDKVKKRRTSLFDKTFEDLESSPNFSSPFGTRPPQVMAPTTINPQPVSGTLHSPCDISPKVYHYTQIMGQFPGLDLGNPFVGPALVPNSSSSNYQPYPCLGVPGITFMPSFLANRTLAPVQFHGGMAYSRPGPGYYSYSIPSKTPVSLHPSGIPTPRPIPHSYLQEHLPMPFAATRSEKADPLELKIGQAPPSSSQGANLSSQPSGVISVV